MNKAFLRHAELLSILAALVLPLCVGTFSAVDWLDYHRDRDDVLAARRTLEHLSALSIALGDAESGQALGTIRSELDELDAATRHDPPRHDEILSLRGLVETGTGKASLDSMRRLISQIRAQESRLSAARELAIRARTDRAYLVAILGSAVLLVVLGLGAGSIRRTSARRERLIARLADLTAALDKAQTMIQTLDGTILVWNSGAEQLYGWPREEAIGRKSHELLE